MASSKRAWATLVTRPSYVPGLLALHRTLISVSTFPLVVLVTESLQEPYRSIITRLGMEIIDIDHLSPTSHSGFDPSFDRFRDTWTKLQVFSLFQFDRLVLIDADTIFLRSMDELFDINLPGDDWIAAAPACVCNPFKFSHYPDDWVPANCSLSHQPRPTTLYAPAVPDPAAPRTSHLLNSGVVILQPRKETFDRLICHLNTSPTIATAKFPDQDVLAEVFHGRWRPLPWWTNALKTERAVHQNVWDDSEVRLIHYILDKPWERRPAFLAPHTSRSRTSGLPTPPPTPSLRPLPSSLVDMVANTPPQSDIQDYNDVHAWWWAVYEDLLDELQEEGEVTGWKDVDQWVKR